MELVSYFAQARGAQPRVPGTISDHVHDPHALSRQYSLHVPGHGFTCSETTLRHDWGAFRVVQGVAKSLFGCDLSEMPVYGVQESP